MCGRLSAGTSTFTTRTWMSIRRSGYPCRSGLSGTRTAAGRTARSRRPRARLSVKLAYWLSDVSEPGRGNLKVVPGSHLVNRIDGPPRRDIRWPDPEGAIEVTAGPGDAVFFDRRIWHTRSRNYSAHTRKAVFFGYTYRWTAIRDEFAPIRASDWSGRLTPVQQQLLGGAEELGGDHAWGHDPATTPLHGWLKERGFLTPAHPPLQP